MGTMCGKCSLSSNVLFLYQWINWYVIHLKLWYTLQHWRKRISYWLIINEAEWHTYTAISQIFHFIGILQKISNQSKMVVQGKTKKKHKIWWERNECHRCGGTVGARPSDPNFRDYFCILFEYRNSCRITFIKCRDQPHRNRLCSNLSTNPILSFYKDRKNLNSLHITSFLKI